MVESQLTYPATPDLVDILTQNNVDIVVTPQNDDSVWVRGLQHFAHPNLVIGRFVLCFTPGSERARESGNELW